MSTSLEDPDFEQVVKIKRLLTKAKKGLPETSSFYNTIYMHTKFMDKCEFYVPHERSLNTIIMWKMTLEGNDMQPQQQQVGLLSYGEEPAAVVQLLNKTKLLDWTLPISFMHMPVSLGNLIIPMLKRKGSGHIHSCSGTLYTMEKKRQRRIPLRCPRGYKVAHLGRKGITKMLESQGSSVYTLQEFQEFATNVPCVGLFLDTNQTEEYVVHKALPHAKDTEVPIAYASVCYSGCIGMLGCEDKQWNDSLVGLVVQVCGRMMANMGLLANIYVQHSSADLKGVMDLLPGWKTGNEVLWAWSCDGSVCP